MGGEGPPQHPQRPQQNTPPGTQPVSLVVFFWMIIKIIYNKIITFFSGSISALGSISELSLWAWARARASGRCRPSSQLWGNKLSHTHCPTHSFFSSPYCRLCVCVCCRSATERCMTTTQLMRMRCRSWTATWSWMCSRSMRDGCTEEWSAPASRGCCRLTM